MPNDVTIKSVCDVFKGKLCETQDFVAASLVREVQRVIDSKGTKKLNTNQARTTRDFLKILAKTAYQ
jgi:hypothetical protein